MNLNRVLEQIRRKYLLRQDSMDEGGWKTINGTHVLIDDNGEMVGGPENLRNWNNARREKNGAKKPRAKAEPLKAENFPAAFQKGVEKKNLQKLIEFVNKCEGADPKVVALFNKMGKLENLASNGVEFKISHAKKSQVVTTINTFTGVLTDVKLSIPKLQGDDLHGQINTIIHEEMHLMDLFGRSDESKSDGWFSSGRQSLMDCFSKRSIDMSDEIMKLFSDFNKAHTETSKKIVDDTKKKIKELRQKYCPDGKEIWQLRSADFKQYEKEEKKLIAEMEAQRDYECRNLMGGGIPHLQDIYDAFSGGDSKGVILKYGHGPRYYSYVDRRVEETVANYACLSITRPDLVDMLRRDKPELVKELDSCVEDLLKKAEER